MSTPIQPVPDIVLAGEFPTLADKLAGTYNQKAKAWADSENAMSVRNREIALTAENNATAATEQAVIATTKAGEATTSAQTATDKAAEAAASAQNLATLDALWLGTAASDPATGKDGAPLVPGNAYVNSVTGYLRAYNGTEWVQGISAVAGVSSVDGQVGALVLKTINGESPLGGGNIDLPLPAAVLAPVGVLPLSGAADLFNVSFEGSPYYTLYGKAQAARQARMSLSPSFDVIAWDSGEIAGAGVTVTGPALDGLIPVSTIVYWQIRYKDVDGAWSAWSQASTFTTPPKYAPTIIGEAFGGGFYAGKIKIGADTYAVITAPKSAEVSLQWKTTNDITNGTTSTADGLANSNSMNNAQHPAAKHCRDYRGGGHDDWYLPAKSELELQYRAFKPDTTANHTGSGANPDSVPTTGVYTAGAPAQTSLVAFKTGGAEAFTANYYWCSTENAGTSTWSQSFSEGNQTTSTKLSSYVVRPCRRFKL